ncbi:hypothetical protein AWC38_SpisGene24041, partial [Stylophora pistillata]
DKFKVSPVVLVTSDHQRSGKEHDAALIWTEDVTKDSFKACLRELQNFDDKHQDIYVLHKPLFTEHGSVNFPNTNPPTDEDNNAYCEVSVQRLGYSAILANDNNYLGYLSSWLSPVVQSQSSYWKRCWRASVDGWAASTFHSLCDNKGPTVTIVRVGKYITGGYTSTSWTSSCAYRYSSSAFLFSLVNKPGWGPVKLSQTGVYGSHNVYSMYNCNDRGPSFGNGHDLHIASYASSNTKSYPYLGNTYSPPSGHSYGSSFTKSFLAGSYKFQPDEVEVFYETT